jgi:hypothetical protein
MTSKNVFLVLTTVDDDEDATEDPHESLADGDLILPIKIFLSFFKRKITYTNPCVAI